MVVNLVCQICAWRDRRYIQIYVFFSTYLTRYINNYFHLPKKSFFEEYAYNRPCGLKFAGFCVVCIFIYSFIYSLTTQEQKVILIGRSVAWL